MADPAGRAGDEMRFRSIETLADLVGRYCWVEHRIFEMTGSWASTRRDDRRDSFGSQDAEHAVPADAGSVDSDSVKAAGPLDAERRVWCAASSRRHGALSVRWRERLPRRAGVDRAVLAPPPPGPLPALLEELAAADDPWDGLDGLVRGVLPGLAETYAAHLRGVSAVSEGPVLEVLMEARREGLRDIRGGLAVLRRVPRAEERAGHGSLKWAGDIERVVERAFDEFSVFPAVRPS